MYQYRLYDIMAIGYAAPALALARPVFVNFEIRWAGHLGALAPLWSSLSRGKLSAYVPIREIRDGPLPSKTPSAWRGVDPLS